MIELQYDLIWITCQRDLCEYGIKNGNWNGYYDNLAARKQRLKELNQQIEEMKAEIKSQEVQQKLF